MDREREVLQALVEFSDSFADNYDVVDFLQRFSERCVALLAVDEAGVMLVDPTKTLRYVASSSEQMRMIELVELQDGEGPCVDSFHSGTVIVSGDADDAARRWPRFAAQARAAGFASCAAVPMRLRDQSIGVLGVFVRRPGALGEETAFVAQALADVATIAVLQAQAIASEHTVTEQLHTALQSRVAIEQAKGIVAEHMRVSVDDAFGLLRRYARTRNMKLTEAARGVVEGTVELGSLGGGRPGERR